MTQSRERSVFLRSDRDPCPEVSAAGRFRARAGSLRERRSARVSDLLLRPFRCQTKSGIVRPMTESKEATCLNDSIVALL